MFHLKTDYLRFLWWDNGNTNEPPSTYRMKVHLFGAASSPSVASYALKRTALDNRLDYDQTITDGILDHFYVDDCLSSVDSVPEAIKLIAELRSACETGGFHLTAFTSSNEEVLKTIPPEDYSKQLKKRDKIN